MKSTVVALLLSGLVHPIVPRAPQGVVEPPLDVQWLSDIGRVTVAASGTRIEIAIDPDGRNIRHVMELAELPPVSRIRAARIAPYMGEHLVVVIAVAEETVTSYRELFLSNPLLRDGATATEVDDPGEPPRVVRFTWRLSTPLFTSTGASYRIVDVHNPSSDALELTFRRGWPKLSESEPKVDEKIFYDACPSMSSQPIQRGRAMLYDVVAVTESR